MVSGFAFCLYLLAHAVLLYLLAHDKKLIQVC